MPTIQGNTLAVFNFFHQCLSPAIHIMVEDGIVSKLGLAGDYRDGLRAALETSLAATFRD